ncbi:hypothetical protein AFV1_ORF95 [Captovirus AFV1]|uniref:Uncharacterized protein ORF95 n=1 Tax=Acidianus filamentous virus 1 (isolate United States/Yellowstone) TaxID=654909 RepID=Y095_AFV1Y|nr:hypothetical protein AFV1_ORF95 [Captovirus AFV1]Q70LE4.1 RecName: Full=Uncharacterized protein ORF95 [Acidianus filamentous virus 1 (isolate Yellowstone)]CAD98936.1 hypothetical protein [Captovirus AFV1]
MGNETGKETSGKEQDKVKDVIIRLVEEDGRIAVYLVQGLNTEFLGYADEIQLAKEIAKLNKFISIWRLNPLDHRLRDYLRQEIIERLVRVMAYMM